MVETNTKFRFTDWDTTKGVEITIVELLKTIKVCMKRNNSLTRKYITCYEHLTGEKFRPELLKEI